MRFRRQARLDPGQVTDVRGRRMGRGGIAVGGGGLGLAGIVVYLLFALLSGGGGLGQLAPLEDQSVGRRDTPSEVSQECRTGEDANERQDCRIVGVVNSVQKFWNTTFARSADDYAYADTVFFTDQVETGCGFASSQVGPFYCPRDKRVYIDLGFFDELESRFDAGGPFAQAYRAVRAELQADCFAGAWAANAVDTGLIERLTQADINEALDAASAIGDDRIQEQTQGQVSPETWTHGSSEQRRRWFSRGYEEGRPDVCDTFTGSI